MIRKRRVSFPRYKANRGDPFRGRRVRRPDWPNAATARIHRNERLRGYRQPRQAKRLHDLMWWRTNPGRWSRASVGYLPTWRPFFSYLWRVRPR